MLPMPNLDDRNFEQLVREARDLIPSLYPDWTDENAHDPGITLLEMLAWHIEMQQFQLDRLTDNHERKFLKLLGEAPRDRTPAMTSVSFSGAGQPVVLPYGALLRVGELPFETVRPVTVLPDCEMSITVHTAEESYEIADDFESGNAPFYPFGPSPRSGSSMLLAMDRPLPESLPLSLWIELLNQDPTHRIPARYQAFTPSGLVEWTYWHEDEEGRGSWQPVAMERDESYSFHQSGPILFHIPPGSSGEVRRLKAQLVSGEYSDPPHIRRLVWNEVFAKQGETLCVSELFDGQPSEPALAGHIAEPQPASLTLAHALFGQGSVAVQFKQEDGGWVDLPADRYEVERADAGAGAVLSFKQGVALPAGSRCIRVIAAAEPFADHTLLGFGTGLSGQACLIPVQPMLPSEMRLQVGWPLHDSETMVWHDWERVHDYDGSHPGSYHYVIDEEDGVIRFSDGVNGAVPPSAPWPNIRMIGFRTGTGAAGNVMANVINELEYIDTLQVTNLFPAYGGAESESVKEAMHRARLSILEPQCGITAEDIERRVLEVPGLRIARVKTIPGYKPSMQNYPAERAFGHISVVVVPHSRLTLPKPGEGMLRTIRRHLEPYRLLTTTLHVIPPEYIKVTVSAVVVVDPRYEGRESEVRDALRAWLQPYGADLLTGWEFGRPIYKSDVFDIIHRLPGIQYIQEVWLMAEGKDAYREEGGDIRIPPNGLVFSGEHDIEFITTS